MRLMAGTSLDNIVRLSRFMSMIIPQRGWV
jgi:hypothetical protein